jgi:phospholipase/carboxylesterase
VAPRNPHLARRPVTAGAALEDAAAAALLVHGRDQDAGVMLDLAAAVALTGVAYVAPEAAGGSWYAGRYSDPLPANEPQVSQALEAFEAALARIARAGVPVQRTVLVGFSQGACLVAELALRAPRRFGGVAVLTGALMGPQDVPRPRPAGLEGVPVRVSCPADDAWITLHDAERAAAAFAACGAGVELARPDAGAHAIHPEDVDAVRELLRGAAAG